MSEHKRGLVMMTQSRIPNAINGRGHPSDGGKSPSMMEMTTSRIQYASKRGYLDKRVYERSQGGYPSKGRYPSKGGYSSEGGYPANKGI